VELLTPSGREPLAQGTLAYEMEVLEEREVRVPAGTFRIYRIRQTFRDGRSQDIREVWFAPRVGEVRTREGRILVERNFR
jgi:DNA-binding winged helix-turn-helix (wHTH) protein